ncbi:hypothetical protein VCHA53O466_50445 [Vibrio chagasii]|nr:hypothetical protein VCHA53O466_50445 [Vibrio chagasii]
MNPKAIYNLESLLSIGQSTAKNVEQDKNRLTAIQAGITEAMQDLELNAPECENFENFVSEAVKLFDSYKSNILSKLSIEIDVNEVITLANQSVINNPDLRFGQALINSTPNEVLAVMPSNRSSVIFHERDATKAMELFNLTIKVNSND